MSYERFFQGGYLREQNVPSPEGKTKLEYDIQYGTFKLVSESYARVSCDMNFNAYPFDTQICNFTIVAWDNTSYQE